MKQETLKLLFRAIDGEPDDDIVKVAHRIIREEQEKGHHNLAKSLKKILDTNVSTSKLLNRELKDIFGNIPKSQRNQIPLASSVDRKNLRRHMVLPPIVEERLQRIEKEYAAKDRLARFGLKPKQKILLYGPPGCGKSMAAERIAWDIGLPFLKVQFEAIISSFLGESASNLKKLFEATRSFPCVLLLDECDFIARSRTSGNEVGEMVRIVNILLALLENYDSPGIVIATTNLETSLDKAIFRRFDDVLEIPKPGEKEIIQLLKMSLSAIECNKDIDFCSLAQKLIGVSAALVVKVAEEAAKLAVLFDHGAVGTKHLEHAYNEVVINNHE
jgi:SpoVK/Ycf46/Vps4 family AAA+-type ATPase